MLKEYDTEKEKTKMKKRIIITSIIISFLILIHSVYAAKPIFITEGTYNVSDLEKIRTHNGLNVNQLVGRFAVESPTVTILYTDDNGYLSLYCAPEKAVLVGINDTDDPNVKRLRFAFRRHDGVNWSAKSYDFSEIGVENLKAWIFVGPSTGNGVFQNEDTSDIILFDEPDKWDEFGKVLFGEEDSNEKRVFKK